MKGTEGVEVVEGTGGAVGAGGEEAGSGSAVTAGTATCTAAGATSGFPSFTVPRPTTGPSFVRK